MKKYLFSLVIGLSSIVAIAQQDPQYSQYLFNGVVINPGYAGSRDYVNINALYRKQWVSVTGSPSSQLLSIDAPIYRNRAGAGIFVFNDNLGAQFRKAVFGSFAYRIKLTEHKKLALGVGVGVNQVGIDGTKLTTDQPDDPAIPTNRMTKTKPDLQAGLYFNTPRFFAGLSFTNLVTNNFKDLQVAPDKRHMYLSSGFVAPISKNFKVRPSILIKEDFKGPTNADLTAFIIFKDRIWFGGSYRTRAMNKSKLENTVARDAVVFMIQLFPIENLRIGYGYDVSLTEFKNYATHEFTVGYNFNSYRDNKMLTPRYF